MPRQSNRKKNPAVIHDESLRIAVHRSDAAGERIRKNWRTLKLTSQPLRLYIGRRLIRPTAECYAAARMATVREI